MEESNGPRRDRRVGFKQLEKDKLLDRQTRLKFRHRKFPDIDIHAIPDWDYGGSSFRVTVDAPPSFDVAKEEMSLASATASILRSLDQQFPGQLSRTEATGNVNPSEYWMIDTPADRNEEPLLLTDVVAQWKAGASPTTPEQ